MLDLNTRPGRRTSSTDRDDSSTSARRCHLISSKVVRQTIQQFFFSHFACPRWRSAASRFNSKGKLNDSHATATACGLSQTTTGCIRFTMAKGKYSLSRFQTKYSVFKRIIAKRTASIQWNTSFRWILRLSYIMNCSPIYKWTPAILSGNDIYLHCTRWYCTAQLNSNSAPCNRMVLDSIEWEVMMFLYACMGCMKDIINM